MRFRVLGPLQVEVAGRPVRISSARQRFVMAALLLSANRTVLADRLAYAVWGDEPPPSAQNLIRTYVWRLRALLPDNGLHHLITEPAGYQLRVATGELDLTEFERLLREGKQALSSGEYEDAARLLRSGLELWRDEPFADVSLHGAGLAAEVRRLSEARIAGWEDRIECDLALGQHSSLIGELEQLAARYPLRERIAGQLMLACYRSNRQADALAAYRRLANKLAVELGVDPSRDQKDLFERILRADLGLLTGRRASAADRQVVPRQLPLAPAHFSGRATELKTLTELIGRPAGQAGIAVISAIGGAAGIGKTALAVHWAHQNRDHFPDGQLYVNLQGFAPGGQPMAPAEAVRGFLDALGVQAERIPPGFQAQVALYRSLVHGRRMLIILDNALDTDQVRPLLAGSPTCMTLVTSRKSLAGLVAAEAAHPIALGLLTPGEAQELLQRRLGHRRATADPGAAAALIDMCARLPLALSIVSARADTSSSTLTDIAVQLHDVRARLDVLDIGDSTTDVRAALSWSYQLLAPGVALMFRLLALHPGPDITPEAAASLAGIPLAEAVQALSDLCQAHMLAEPAPGRYSFHDLLRAYAAELADKHEIQARRAEAAGRILDYYLHTAHKADQLLRPAREDPIVLEPFRPGTRPAGLADEAAALTWLEAEHQVLLAVVTQAFKDGHYTHAWQLAWALDTYLDRRVHWHDYGATQHTALAAAVRISNRDWQARTHQCLGWYFSQLGDHEQAIFHCRRALDLYQHLADMGGQARAYRGLGWVCEQQGRTEEALRYAQLALDLYRSIGHTAGYISALNAVGWLHGLLGDQQQALAHCQRALRLMRLANDDSSKAHTLDSMGHAHHQLGEHDQARLCYRRALRLFRKLGDRYYEAIVLGHLADTCLDAGEPHAAQQAWQRALAILDDLSLPEAEGVRGKLSQLLQSSGQAPDGM